MRILLLILFTFKPEFSQSKLDKVYEKLPSVTQIAIENFAKNFSLIKPPRVQVGLLKEELKWRVRGYTERQIILSTIMALYKAVNLAEEVLDNPTEEQKKKLNDIIFFVEIGKDIVNFETKKLGELSEGELNFYLH